MCGAGEAGRMGVAGSSVGGINTAASVGRGFCGMRGKRGINLEAVLRMLPRALI